MFMILSVSFFKIQILFRKYQYVSIPILLRDRDIQAPERTGKFTAAEALKTSKRFSDSMTGSVAVELAGL